MRNIIIWGPVRAGKSYIARELKKYFSMNIIEIDCLRQLIEKGFPQIDWECIDSFDAGRIIGGCLSEYIYNTTHEANKYNEFYIFEGSSIDILELSKSLDVCNFEVILIAYPSVTIEEKLKQIRTFENSDDWTTQFDDDQLKDICRTNIEYSHLVEKTAKELNLSFFDISDKPRNIVVKEIIQHLIERDFERRTDET